MVGQTGDRQTGRDRDLFLGWHGMRAITAGQLDSGRRGQTAYLPFVCLPPRVAVCCSGGLVPHWPADEWTRWADGHAPMCLQHNSMHGFNKHGRVSHRAFLGVVPVSGGVVTVGCAATAGIRRGDMYSLSSLLLLTPSLTATN